MLAQRDNCAEVGYWDTGAPSCLSPTDQTQKASVISWSLCLASDSSITMQDEKRELGEPMCYTGPILTHICHGLSGLRKVPGSHLYNAFS